MKISWTLILLCAVTFLLVASVEGGRRRGGRGGRGHRRRFKKHATSSGRRRHRRGHRPEYLEFSTHLETPIRHRDPLSRREGIAVGRARDPPQCPPPVRPFSPELCFAPSCLNHRECRRAAAAAAAASSPATQSNSRRRGRSPSRNHHHHYNEHHGEPACCFNGCIHTCLPALKSPPVIDWIEDTNSIDFGDPVKPEYPIRYEDPPFAEGGEEVVHMPGGCTITAQQHLELRVFMDTPSINDCTCIHGEVVCSIKLFKT